LRRLVDLDDHALAVECDHPVRQRFQDALVVVFQRENIRKQARVFECHRDVRREGLEPPDVDCAELAASFVENLDHAEALAGAVDHRYVEQIAGAKPRPQIEFTIEAPVGISVRNVQHVAAGEGRPGDPGIRRYADLLLLGAFGNSRPELVFARVVNEERRAFGIEELSCRRHDARKQGVEVQFRRDRLADCQQFQFFAPSLLEAFHHLRLLERARGLAADRIQNGHVGRSKRALALVQHLGHANDLVGAVAQGRAQNAASAIPGLPVYSGLKRASR